MNETDRFIQVARELTERVGGALEDVIPPEARLHLLNAQRELLTALLLIYEHQAGGRRPQPQARRRARPSARSAAAGAGQEPASRIKKITID